MATKLQGLPQIRRTAAVLHEEITEPAGGGILTAGLLSEFAQTVDAQRLRLCRKNPASTAMVELMGQAGSDHVSFDSEHGPLQALC